MLARHALIRAPLPKYFRRLGSCSFRSVSVDMCTQSYNTLVCDRVIIIGSDSIDGISPTNTINNNWKNWKRFESLNGAAGEKVEILINLGD